MDKRYQVFVSSTYRDLIPERLEVMKALLELDCIPCGMEYFPASNDDQWTFIKNLIDTCDYYVVIVGGCYGSEDANGKSYTRKEYEYAVSKNIPTIGFIHYDASSLPEGKKDITETQVQKLKEFIAIVKGKLCKNWRNGDELGAVVSRSLTQLMKSNPRTGWVRADKVGSEDILMEINTLRKGNETLKTTIAAFEKERAIEEDAQDLEFENAVKLFGTYKARHDGYTKKWEYTTSWKNIFLIVSPYLIEWYPETIIQLKIASVLLKATGLDDCHTEHLDDEIFQTIKVQFLALGLVQVQSLNLKQGGVGLFWGLTPKGKQLMLRERSVRITSKP